jgi:hypothetical protein
MFLKDGGYEDEFLGWWRGGPGLKPLIRGHFFVRLKPSAQSEKATVMCSNFRRVGAWKWRMSGRLFCGGFEDRGGAVEGIGERG